MAIGGPAGAGGPPTGGSVSAVGLATVGRDNILIIKMDQPIPPGTDEATLVIKISKPPAAAPGLAPGLAPAPVAPAGGAVAAFCVCNSNHATCGTFFF